MGAQRIALVVVLLLAALSYVTALGNGFVYDDHDLVERNPLVVDGMTRVPEHFTNDFWGPTRHESAYYRPAVTLSLLADATVWGMRPLGFHLQNVAWHLVATVLVLVLLRRLLPGRPRASLVGAGLFAVHPIHTQSVAWIAGRTDLMATVAVLGSVLAYLRYRAHGRPRDLVLFGLVLAAGLLAKETVVTGVGILVVLELVLRRVGPSPEVGGGATRSESEGRAWWRAGAVSVALLAGFFVVRRLVLGTSVGLDTAADPTAWWQPEDGTAARLRTVGTILLFYLTKLVAPINLSLEDGITLAPSLDGPSLLGFGLVVVLLLVAILAWRRSPQVTLALAVMLLPLAPVANVLPLYQPAQEHFLYLPSVGLSLLVAMGVARLPGHVVVNAAIALVLLGLATMTLLRNLAWRDDVSIWADAVVKHPHSSRAQVGLATAHFMAGRSDSARVWIDRALADHPDHFHATLLAGVLAEERGDRSTADDRFARAHALHPANETARYNHGRSLVRQGRDADAVRVLAPLLPTTDDAEVLFQGARAHAGIGDRDRAIALSRRALEQRPDMGAAWLHLATWLEADGETDPALDAFARARALAPDHPGLAFTVARAQARAGRLDDAWKTLTAAIELGYRDTAAVRSAPELAPLRERAGFDELVRGMSGPR